MQIYQIYTARLDHSKVNKFKGEIEAENLEEVKDIISKTLDKGGFNLNPYYSVIIEKETGKILKNEFCAFYVGK
jgi:hypothetical protein